MKHRTWEELGDHAEDHRRDAAEDRAPSPAFDVGDTVRINPAYRREEIAGRTGTVTEVDAAIRSDDQTLYQLKLDGLHAPSYPGGWWLDESDITAHDHDQEDDGA